MAVLLAHPNEPASSTLAGPASDTTATRTASGAHRRSCAGIVRRYPRSVAGVVNGDRWIAERLAFLRERLAADPPADERAAIEAEIEVLSKERGITFAGVRLPLFLRRLRRR